MLVLALVVVLSFVVGAPLSQRTHSLYSRLEPMLLRFERGGKHPDDVLQVLGSARSLVFGMRRTGTAAYTALGEQDKRPVGLDSDPAKIEYHLREGRRVVYGDADDSGLWETLNLGSLEIIILTLPDFEARLRAVESVRERGFEGVVSTISMYPEEEEPLREAGADLIAHPLGEAGSGLAERSLRSVTP